MKRTFALILLLLPLRDNKARKTYRWNLDIGEATAVFYNPAARQYLQESDELRHSTEDIMAGIAGLQQLWAKYPNTSYLQVLTGKPKPGQYTYSVIRRRPGCMAARGQCGIVRNCPCPTARTCWADCRGLS